MTIPPDELRPPDRSALKALPAVREIALRWRRLTEGGGATLVACSGGADSGALALALWSVGAPITLGHVVHDLRPEAEAMSDRDVVRALAERLGVGFVESRVAVAGAGNNEGDARRERYAALAGLARAGGLGFVASAHQADDQLESMLMAIARGAGLDGLAGVAPSRSIGEGVTLIRPMLGSTRGDAERICSIGGYDWTLDTTNNDLARFRNAVRAGPARALKVLRPEAPSGAVRAGELLRDAADMIRERAGELFGDSFEWDRAALRSAPGVVLGAGLRSAALRLTGGAGADQLSRRVIAPVVRAIRDDSTEPRRFDWPLGLRVALTAHHVRMTTRET